MLVLRSNDAYVRSLAFAPDAATLYAGHNNSQLWAWNLADRTAAPVEFGGETMTHAFDPLLGGRWAVSQTIKASRYAGRLIDLAVGTTRPHLLFAWYGVADCDRLVGFGHSTCDDDRPADPQCQRFYGFEMAADGPEYVWHRDIPANVHPRGVARLGPGRFATAELISPGYGEWRMQASVRRATDGGTEIDLDCPQQHTQQLLGSPDGTRLVARTGMELRVWDTTDWKRPPLVVEGKHKGAMTEPAAAFTPDGRFLLLANEGPSVLVYDTATWTVVRKWKWDVGGVLRVVAVSPDGSLAAAAGPRGAIAVWDLDL